MKSQSLGLIQSLIKQTRLCPLSNIRDEMTPSSGSTQYKTRRGTSSRRLDGQRTSLVTSGIASLPSRFTDITLGLSPHSVQYSFLSAYHNGISDLFSTGYMVSYIRILKWELKVTRNDPKHCIQTKFCFDCRSLKFNYSKCRRISVQFLRFFVAQTVLLLNCSIYYISF